MSDIEPEHTDFVSSTVGLLSLVRQTGNYNLGTVDYRSLSAIEFDSITYLGSKIDDLRKMMKG